MNYVSNKKTNNPNDREGNVKEFINVLKNCVMVVCVIAAMCAFTYGAYWITKTGSYKFFYEDMVIRTIHEQVPPKYLIK